MPQTQEKKPKSANPAKSATERLGEIGQSIWLDDITRDLLDQGTLEEYIAKFHVTGLTSNPSIFDHAIAGSATYDKEIKRLVGKGLKSEALLFALIIEDLSRAADLFLPIHQRTAGTDGWVSLEVSPLLAHDMKRTVESARALSRQASKPNLFIKIPGTTEGLPAIEESIFHGVPINVTLLFSPEQYAAAADAYMRGLERRIEAGTAPDVRSVASVFVSRWDVAIAKTAPENLRNKLGLEIGRLAYKAYRDVLDSDRWQRLENLGAHPQRLLFASTGTKDPKASDVLYIEGLAAPNTVNTMPQKTLRAAAEHGTIARTLAQDGGGGTVKLFDFERAGIDTKALAEQLQREGAEAFVRSWQDLLKSVETKCDTLSKDKP